MNESPDHTYADSFAGRMNRDDPVEMNALAILLRHHLEFRVLHAEALSAQANFAVDDHPCAGHDALLDMEQIEPLEREARNRIKSGALPINDLLGQIQKMDSTLAVDEEALRSKFSKTTPQGREVVRKLALRLGKATRR